MSFIWTTREGEKLKPNQMGDRHLLNALRMVQNHIVDMKEMNQFAWSPFAPQGEIASEMFEEAMDEMLEDSPRWYEAERALKREAKKRGLKPLPCKKVEPLPKVKRIEYLDGGGTLMEIER